MYVFNSRQTNISLLVTLTTGHWLKTRSNTNDRYENTLKFSGELLILRLQLCRGCGIQPDTYMYIVECAIFSITNGQTLSPYHHFAGSKKHADDRKATRCMLKFNHSYSLLPRWLLLTFCSTAFVSAPNTQCPHLQNCAYSFQSNL